MKKIIRCLFSALFVIILISGALIFQFKPKKTTSYYENRALAAMPVYSTAALLDGTYFSAMTDYVSDHAPLRETLVRINSSVDLTFCRRPVVNGTVVTDDALLVYKTEAELETPYTEEACFYMVDQFAKLNELVTSYGGTFLYVAVPGQTVCYSDSYPWYIPNPAVADLQRRDAFAAEMARREVPLLDVGNRYEELGWPDGLFSPTDYHYTFFGAFEAYSEIMRWFGDNTDLDLRTYGEDEIDIQVLANPYLGSRRRMLNGLWKNTEHTAIGTFKEVIPFVRYENGVEFVPTCYALPWNDTTTELTYSIYMGGDCAETWIQTDRAELPNLLIFGDSFTNPVECLLYASFDEMRSLDLRHYKSMSLFEYVDMYRPEAVICLRDYEALMNFDGNGTLY